MSKVAERITGMSKAQFVEYEYRRVTSSRQVMQQRGTVTRGNSRFAAGMLVGSDDLKAERERLAKSMPKHSRK